MRLCCRNTESNASQNSWWPVWKQQLAAVALTFLCNVESSMLMTGEWPYMSTAIKIDEDATADFFGASTAANKAAHMISLFAFAFWAYKTSSIKIPMIVGRCVALLACVMYAFVEFIPTNRRWWMLACYVLFGAGFGTSPLLRSFIVRTTSEEARSSAYALQSGAVMLSMMVGPMAQLAFTGLPYPGVDIIPPHLKLNVYSGKRPAPIWFAMITDIIAILVAVCLLRDPEAVENLDEKASSSSLSLPASIRLQVHAIRTLRLPWTLIALVLTEKIINGIFFATIFAIVGPMFTSMYGFSGQLIVVIMGSAQIVVGLLAVGFSLTFALCKLGNRVSCRVLFAFSNILIIAGYIITYPYPFMSAPMQPYNETTRTGCDPEAYSWCDSQLVVNIFPFVASIVIIVSFAIPSATLSLDTVYSKIIGNIDQNMMQSVFVVADDFTSIVGPIYGSAVFTAIGVGNLTIINACFYIIGTMMWFAAWKWLQPYN